MSFCRFCCAMCAALVLSCTGGNGSSGDAGEDEEISLPDSWIVGGDDYGISATVDREPFGYTVLDGAGNPVLASLGPGDGEGYGTLGYARGDVVWENVLTSGYFSFTPGLDPWVDDLVVVEATEREGELELLLTPRDASTPVVNVLFSVRTSALRVEASLVSDDPRAWATAFATDGAEAFLGFGERFNRTDQQGVDVYCWTEEGGIGTGEGDPPGPANPNPNGEAMTYYPVPFFISTSGYGFWLDSTWRSEFNLGTDHDDSWRVWHIGPDIAFEVYVPGPADVRPWPHHLIDSFTAATGRPMLPPAWTLGPRRRINRNDEQGGVPEIQAMRDLDLAITGIDDSMHLLPAGRHLGLESELSAWIADAEGLGYRVNAYYNAFLSTAPDSPLADMVTEGVDNDYFLLETSGDPSEVWLVSGSPVDVYMIDFTYADAAAWYQSMLQWAIDLGYSGWMSDFGEYVQVDTLSHSGMTGEELHNLYPLLFHQAVHDYLETTSLAGDWLTFVRSGYTGVSQYSPHVWSGDPAASFEESDGLPSMVRAGINASISGVPFWGGDINGFHCLADGYAAADEELLVRWIQQGSMTPNMQDQDACVAALDTGRKANIFDDPLAQDAWRTYARLHTRLFPYLHTLSHEAHDTGAPIIRHVFLEHPDRPDLASVDDAYYFGPALLVAPVVERGATTKVVDLPAGTYLDWSDRLLFDGGEVVTVDAPLAKLPLLLRDGHIVPMIDPTIDTLAEETHIDVVGLVDVSHVYDVVGLVTTTSAAASFTLWDGEAMDVAWTGGFGPPSGFSEAGSEGELSTCSDCYLVEDLGSGLSRVRITSADPGVTAGGLEVSHDTGRTIRWDLYLVE